MTRLDVPEAAARGVHGFLGGQGGAFADFLARSRAARGGGTVIWQVTVCRSTVYHLESLHRFAEGEGAELEFVVDPGLSERERAFFADHARHRVAKRRPGALLGEYLSGAREAMAALRSAMVRTRCTPAPATCLRSVVIIGAYGGDHVGDAAILGGVLQALQSRHGVERATVMSHRPAHTRRLVAGLALPVEVSVEDYRPGRVARLLDDCDALVLAGGPVVDLPRVLAKHLAAAHAARVRGKPFLIERVGLGEFGRRLSLRAARETLALAHSISVRSSESAGHPLLRGFDVGIGRDPAFDYLATRQALDRLAEHDRSSVEALLAESDDALRIGINLRPVSNDWHPRGAQHAARTVDRFMAALADGMARFAAESQRAVHFVFFPMNSIQFGMSDLTAAYRLHALLGGRARLLVWEADPDVDGVLHLLRRLDAAVVMRLHAAIFSFSQRVPVLGIDYFADRNSKLTQLFRDERRDQDLCGMEAFTADWMQERLALALQQAGNRRAGGAGRSDDEAARLPAGTVSDRKP